MQANQGESSVGSEERGVVGIKRERRTKKERKNKEVFVGILLVVRKRAL